MTPTEAAIQHHSEIDLRYTWNAASVFPTVAAWEAEYDAVAAALPSLAAFQGHLAEGAAALSVTLEAVQSLARRVGILAVYAGMDYAVDTGNQPAAKRYGRVQGLRGQLAAASAFVGPELLAIGEESVRGWLAGDPQLAYLKHYVDNLFRKQAHMRSAEVEELLGSLAAPFANVEMTASMLTDADFKFPGATGSRREHAAGDAGHAGQDPGGRRPGGATHRLGRLHGYLPGLQKHPGGEPADLRQIQRVLDACVGVMPPRWRWRWPSTTPR